MPDNVVALIDGGTPQPRLRIAEIKVTPAMMAAGRAAFVRHRRNLSDLYEFFDCDRDQFIAAIFRSMAREA